MKKFLTVLAVLVVVVAAGAGGYLLFKSEQPSASYGAASGTDHYNREFFNAALSSGGAISTSSAATAYTTAASDWKDATFISWNPTKNITVSLSATSTAAIVPKIGDTADLYFLNASTTQASTITFAAVDANSDLQFAEATGGDLVLNGLDFEKLTIIRESRYKVGFILDEMTEAD